MARIDFKTPVTTLRGEQTTLESYAGKVLLIVNTASKCGFTPQYEGLQKLHDTYSDQEFEVLGFPCNQFGRQEPGTADDISQFCQVNYGVSFPMFSKIDVNGRNTHPLYKQLKSAQKGFLGTEAIKWNFTKFLVAKDGTVLARYAPKDTPESLHAVIMKHLEA